VLQLHRGLRACSLAGTTGRDGDIGGEAVRELEQRRLAADCYDAVRQAAERLQSGRRFDMHTVRTFHAELAALRATADAAFRDDLEDDAARPTAVGPHRRAASLQAPRPELTIRVSGSRV
jgi:hypothetical protein